MLRQALAFCSRRPDFAVQVHESAIAFLKRHAKAASGVHRDRHPHARHGRARLQRKLAADRNHTPIILMTGHADVALAIEAMKARRFRFLRETLRNEILLEAIRAALARQSGERPARPAPRRGPSAASISVGTGTTGA